MIKLLFIGLVVVIINIPFGYWRTHARRFSLQWFLAIHIPVIFVIVLRLTFHLGFVWYSYVVLVTAFILGQQFGYLMNKILRQNCVNVTSCLVMDLLRFRGH